jgi:hypothetical protein
MKIPPAKEFMLLKIHDVYVLLFSYESITALSLVPTLLPTQFLRIPSLDG